MSKSKNAASETAPKNDASNEAPKQTENKASEPKFSQIKKITNKEFSKVPTGGTILIAGIILGFQAGEGQYGPYTKFTGDFAATFTPKDATEATTLRSTRLYLPEIAEELLMNHVAGFLSEDDRDVADIKKVGGLHFALRLVKTDDSENTRNARGWTWTVEPVGKVSTNEDRVAELMEKARQE